MSSPVRYRKRERTSRSPDRRSRTRQRSPSRSSHARSPDRERFKKPFPKSKKKKSKTKHKRRRQSSSSSSSSSEDEEKQLKKLVKYREVQKRKETDKKARMKALETPEEKRRRRLDKKEKKERREKERAGWTEETLHYTNSENPYGDTNLHSTFLWEKELKYHQMDSFSKDEILRVKRQQAEENKKELAQVNKRRNERELERAERDLQLELEQRDREAAQFSQFAKQEDRFQLEQATVRSQIRVRDGRAKPIDLLAQYISCSTDDDQKADASMVVLSKVPYEHLKGLTINDLDDLLEDIKVYQKLDSENLNQDYWNDLTTIVSDEFRRLKLLNAGSAAPRDGVHASVVEDVIKQFQNKTSVQLDKLRVQIRNKLSGGENLDVGYWESLLSQLSAFQARARLKEMHKENLSKKLEILRKELGQNVDEPSLDASPEQAEDANDKATEDDEATSEEELDAQSSESAMIERCAAAYVAGRMSPKPLSSASMEAGTVVAEAGEDAKRLEWARLQVRRGAAGPGTTELTVEERRMRKEAENNMTGDEVQFSVESKLDPQKYLWSDKYRPRKPRYFNRVHTGFEWNKYNQTHYDMDNPPPKIVQGYKFNIFYPDLIVKSDAPVYHLIPIADDPDFVMLKFTAGPPYEDIAFKIVKREWEYSYKRGFKSQFHNNIFQLWFHFKRYRYRR